MFRTRQIFVKHFHSLSFRRQLFKRPTKLSIKRKFGTDLKTLEFKLTKKEASVKFKDSIGLMEEKPKQTEEKNSYTHESISGHFIPFYSANVQDLTSEFSVRYGIDTTEWNLRDVWDEATKTWSQQLVPETVTEWYNVSGTLSPNTYPLGTMTTQIYAGFNHPRKIIHDTLRTRHISSDLVKFTNAHVKMNDRIVEKHEMNIAFGLENIVSELHNMEEERVRQYIRSKYDADDVRVKNLKLNTHLAKIDMYSYFIPAYLYRYPLRVISPKGGYQVEEKTVTKFLNAFTGDLGGEKLYSFWKSAFIGAGIGGIATGLLLPQSMTFFALRVLAMATLSGGMSGGLVRMASITRNEKYVRQNEEDRKKNSTYIETTEDKAHKITDGQTCATNDSKVSDFPFDVNNKLILLGMQINKVFTTDDLKNAYFDKVKIWHPDTYEGDKFIANTMIVQLKEAHDFLLKYATSV